MMVVIAIADARAAKRAGADAIAAGSLAAVVRRARSAPKVSERALKTQAAELARLEKLGLSVLPVRFGTTVRDEAELRKLIAPLAPQLRKALALTRNRRQMTVRVRGVRDDAPRTSGREYLAARVKAARVPEADVVRKAVAPLVIAEQLSEAKPPFLGAVHHLIESRDVNKYAKAVAAVQRDAPGRFLVTGPMAPFAFTTTPDIHAEG